MSFPYYKNGVKGERVSEETNKTYKKKYGLLKKLVKRYVYVSVYMFHSRLMKSLILLRFYYFYSFFRKMQLYVIKYSDSKKK